MDLNTYQQLTSKTAIYPQNQAIDYLVLGLASEAGEVAGKLKKIIRDKPDPLTLPHIARSMASEVGDVLWYVARLSDELGFSLETIALENLDKLESRYERGTIKGSGDNR